MDNKERTMVDRLNTTENYLTATETIFANNVAFKAMRAKVKSSQTDVAARAAATGTDNSGYSQQKDDAKLDMADLASILSGNAYVHFEEAGKHDLSAQCHINITDYTTLADAQAAAAAQAAHDFLNDNITELSPDSVTANDLIDLQTTINTFTATKGNSSVAHQVSAADTAAFKADVATANDRIAKLLILARKYKKTNAEFYDKLVLAATLPPANVHHTTISITVLDATTKTPIAGAVVSIDNSTKTATSNATGLAKIERVKAGNSNLTITAAGKTKNITIAVQRGKDNVVSVEV